MTCSAGPRCWRQPLTECHSIVAGNGSLYRPSVGAIGSPHDPLRRNHGRMAPEQAGQRLQPCPGWIGVRAHSAAPSQQQTMAWALPIAQASAKKRMPSRLPSTCGILGLDRPKGRAAISQTDHTSTPHSLPSSSSSFFPKWFVGSANVGTGGDGLFFFWQAADILVTVSVLRWQDHCCFCRRLQMQTRRTSVPHNGKSRSCYSFLFIYHQQPYMQKATVASCSSARILFYTLV